MEPRSLLRLLTMISSREELERTAIHYGILPFFANHIPEFSVQEMAAPGMLFADNPDEAGCWEWKGPVIREQTTAYGKFFRRKAGFVAVRLLPDFINYRRAAYPVLQGSIDEEIMHLFNSCDGLSSTQIKHLMKSNRIESPLQRLQMGTWINIADFEAPPDIAMDGASLSTPPLSNGSLQLSSNAMPHLWNHFTNYVHTSAHASPTFHFQP